MRRRPTGISVGQMRVPIGAFGMIYESRPNVTIEAASLAIKSGNACVLRGGSEAIHSNLALWKLVQAALTRGRSARHTPCNWCRPPTAPPWASSITMPQYVDVIIPRGGKGLIERITAEARGAGHQTPRRQLPHLMWTSAGGPRPGREVTDNAKTQKYSPCNAPPSACWRRVNWPDPSCPKIGAVFAAKGVEMRCAARQVLCFWQGWPAPRWWTPPSRIGSEEYLAPMISGEGGGLRWTRPWPTSTSYGQHATPMPS